MASARDASSSARQDVGRAVNALHPGHPSGELFRQDTQRTNVVRIELQRALA